MKKILIYIMMFGLFASTYSCESYFLQKPEISGSANLNTVYENSVNAFQAVMQCYRQTLGTGMPPQFAFSYQGQLGSMTDELSRGYSFEGIYSLPDVGFTANSAANNPAQSDDFYGNNFNYIRANFLVAENIDKVPDMSAADKATIKAEMAGLNAYRYMGMFYRYGGVPIITKSFLPTDNASVPRASLDSTLQYTLQLCNQAIAGLPDSWPANMTGRLTKGAVMAMKARLWMYAARPLFNSTTPYLDNGTHNNLICFGPKASPARWDSAIVANQAVLNWANQNGYGIINTGNTGVGQPDPNAFADYGTATSTPANSEVLLAYKSDYTFTSTNSLAFSYNYSAYQTTSRYDTNLQGTLYNFFKNYYNADGTDASWPQVGDAAPRPASDYLARTAALEPRFHADQIGPGFDATKTNNPGDAKWNINGWNRNMNNHAAVFPSASYGCGCSIPTKFYYHAGSRVWFEMPLFRMAEIYLNLAEAYNEAPDRNVTLALQYLNVVHNRAGLPAITETDQTKLRAIIQREWAIEFFEEGQRLFQVKAWKLADIGTDILGGPVMEFQWKVTGASNNNLAANLVNYWNAVTYSKYWNSRMFLDPIPQSEINKGVAVQNPGY
jgi:hypothetical protein